MLLANSRVAGGMGFALPDSGLGTSDAFAADVIVRASVVFTLSCRTC